MQPTYLPWCGYFDLMDQADVFVILDTVQFSHQSWQHRNRIRTRDGLTWLTVPVITKGRHGQRILDVELAADQGFPEKHVHLLNLNYRDSPGAKLLDEVIPLLEAGSTRGRLPDLTVPLLAQLAASFDIRTPLISASQLDVTGQRSELLVRVCSMVGASHYLAPPGSVEYLTRDSLVFADAGIEVSVHAYDHPVYNQRFEPFLPNASAIDLLLREGATAGDVIRSGRRESLPLESAAS
jgi:hypothetical protein